jgi:low temperature requirement protein LtrA
MAAVLAGGMAGHEAQYWLWGMAILLDVLAAAVGGQMDGWELHPEHFAERHGLFVIIALGETLIVTASGLAGAAWTVHTCAIAILAVAVTCGLWWTYFPRSKPRLEEALASHKGMRQSTMARDAFSLMHFPMMCGVIAYAAAIEETAAHPGEPIGATARVALALGLLLFVGGMAGAMWRATCGRLLPRLVIVAAPGGAIVALEGVDPLVTLGVAFAGIAAIGGIEQRSTAP